MVYVKNSKFDLKKKKSLGAIPESFKKIALHPHLLHVTPNERIYALLWLHDRTS